MRHIIQAADYLVKKACATVLHNGVAVQKHRQLRRAATFSHEFELYFFIVRRA
jgi:hypothetical protein